MLKLFKKLNENRRDYILVMLVKMVYRNIKADAVRSFMTCLGIIIGTASLISMMTIMDLRTEKSMLSIDENGIAEVWLTVYQDYMGNGLLEGHLKHLSEIDNVKGVTPLLYGVDRLSLKKDTKNVKDIQLYGVDEEYYTISLQRKFETGRAMTKAEVKRLEYVCVISRKLAKKLFGSVDCCGQTIRVNGHDFEVVGVSSPAGSEMDELYVAIPYTLLEKISGVGTFDFIIYPENHDVAKQVDSDAVMYVQSLVHDVKYEAFYDTFDIWGMEDEITKVKDAATLQLVIAAISMIIGGIGIMNMMLVMVSERTTEIGLRKALGSSNTRIQAQFVIESMLLSLTGGLIGVVAGSVFSLGYCIAMGERLHLNIPSVFVSLFFSMAVGIFFGWSPAKAASRLNPIDALKGE